MKLCKVADVQDWNDPEFEDIAALLDCPGRHRKAWEFIHVYKGLKSLGLLDGTKRCLGLGVGHECLVYAFTNVCERVVATDLYESQSWSTAAMTVEDVYNRNTIPYDRAKLTVQHMDMTQIDYPDNSFDIIWSCCAVEHVHNFALLHQVYREIYRVLKPGGVAAITTEYNPSPHHSYEPNMLFTDQHWLHHWLSKSDPLIQGLELMDDLDLSLSDHSHNAPKVRYDPANSIQVYCNDIVLNSVAFFLRKPESAPPSPSFSPYQEGPWLSTFWQQYLSACDDRREGDLSNAEQSLRSLLQQNDLHLRERIRAERYLVDVLLGQSKPDDAKAICLHLIEDCNALENGQEGNDDSVMPIPNLMAIANLCYACEFREEAHRLYQQAAVSRSSTMDTILRSLLRQAEYYQHHQDYAQALVQLDALAEKMAQGFHTRDLQSKADYHRGQCYEGLGQMDKAVNAYQRSVEQAMHHAGSTLQSWIDVINSLKAVIESKCDRQSLAFDCEEILGQIMQQVASGSNHSGVDEQRGRIALRTGILYQKLGNKPQAATCFQHALTLAPATSNVHQRAQRRHAKLQKIT